MEESDADANVIVRSVCQSTTLSCAYRWHSRKEREEDTRPAGGKDGLHGSNVILSARTVHRAEGECRRDDGDKHEQRNSDSALVQVCHLLDPVSSNCALEVVDEAASPRLSGF